MKKQGNGSKKGKQSYLLSQQNEECKIQSKYQTFENKFNEEDKNEEQFVV